MRFILNKIICLFRGHDIMIFNDNIVSTYPLTNKITFGHEEFNFTIQKSGLLFSFNNDKQSIIYSITPCLRCGMFVHCEINKNLEDERMIKDLIE